MDGNRTARETNGAAQVPQRAAGGGQALAAVGASPRCVGPFAPLALGVGGAWMSGLGVPEPYRPLLLAVALGFWPLAFHRVHLRPRPCGRAGACVPTAPPRRERLISWAATVAVAAAAAFPRYAPLSWGWAETVPGMRG